MKVEFFSLTRCCNEPEAGFATLFRSKILVDDHAYNIIFLHWFFIKCVASKSSRFFCRMIIRKL